MAAARFRCVATNWRLVGDTAAEREHWREVRWPMAKQMLLDPAYGRWSSLHEQESSRYVRATFELDDAFPETFDPDMAHFSFFRFGNVGHRIDTRVHQRTDRWAGDSHTGPGGVATILPSPEGMDRHFIVTENVHLATDTVWYGASCHLTVGTGSYDGIPAATWRARQMEAAVDFIAEHADPAKVIFGGDLNSILTTQGPRGIAKAAGIGNLRGKVGPDQLRNRQANSYATSNPPPQEGEWIDDVLTGSLVEPYYSRLLNAWPSSDHGKLMASVVLLY